MDWINFRIIGLTAILVTATVSGAEAVTLTDSQIFSQFNAVVFGNFSSTSDVEGRTAVGGTVSGGATFALNPGSAAASSFSALTVYGSVTAGGSFNIDAASGLAVLGGNNASFTLNAGGSVYIAGANSGAITVNGGSAAIAVNGNNTANLTLNGGGTVRVNGNNTGNVSGGSITLTGSQSGNLNGGATATHVTSLTLTPPASTASSFAATFQNPLTALSTQLNTLTANSTVTTAGNAITFNAKPNAAGTAVFDINTSVFTANGTVTLALGNATTAIVYVLVNGCVSGPCAFSMPNSVNFSNPTGYAATVLWNFVNATNLSFTNEFGGSVLAPLASVTTNNNPVDGTVVAASFTGTGELHSHPFTGTLPSTSVPAPEPTSLMLFGSGIASLAALQRRRKKRQRTGSAQRGHAL